GREVSCVPRDLHAWEGACDVSISRARRYAQGGARPPLALRANSRTASEAAAGRLEGERNPAKRSLPPLGARRLADPWRDVFPARGGPNREFRAAGVPHDEGWLSAGIACVG